MAAPTYATDLTDIITDPASSTGWTLISSGGGGANSFTVPETDDYIQSATVGTYGCISRNPWSSSIRGMVYNSSQTIPSGDVVWIWTKSDVAQALDSKANGGIQALIGNATTALNLFYVSGNDDAFGGWKCYPVDPTVTPSSTLGSPTSTTSYFGVRWNVPSGGPSKGYPFKIDAIRYGRAMTCTNGETSNYATFSGAATYQGNIARQWGQLQFQNGTYLMQGLFELGTSGTIVDFRDSNRVIFIANTEFVASTFNGIEVNNASSVVYWDNISISALGTVSKGYFLANADADIQLTNCTFVDMNTFDFDASSIIDGCVFRRCGLITPNGCTFENNSLAAPSGTIAVTTAASDLGNIQFNTFTSDGTGHGLEITGSAGTYSLIGNVFTGYAGSNGSTGNEAIYVNIGTGTVTLNVTSGGSTPSIRTAGATVVVNNNIAVTLTGMKDNTEVRVYSVGTTTELDGVENATSGTTNNRSFTFSLTAGTGVDIRIYAVGYLPADILDFTVPTGDTSLPIQQVADRWYTNP